MAFVMLLELFVRRSLATVVVSGYAASKTDTIILR